ncbi:MAG: 1-deoxy-D-xylulose-5-phosphate reductoisomerase [Spirochaetales bacterium]|nr:1-deoxy-D-xylulose-5-phosphate reductoisomerase [Spirochaetales bacterium]
MKKVIVLGCTGSIGASTMDIIAQFPGEFSVEALSAHSARSSEILLKYKSVYGGAKLALTGVETPPEGIDYAGTDGLLRMIEETGADIVVNGISGAAGLLPSIKSLESGKDLALANKETIVTAGDLIFALAEKMGCTILPVDSEHSALFHLLMGRDPDTVSELILTASGGPFVDMPFEEQKGVTPARALKHPNWDMGAKISIDSATLANKGLEVIEAWKLFHLPLDRISVLVHRQSLVHSLIRTKDNALYGQFSSPDMKLPIQNALFYPELRPVEAAYTDLCGPALTFEKPDRKRFPMLDLAYKSAELGGPAPIVYNGSNEIAVAAFLKEEIGFTQIGEVTDAMLNLSWPDPQNTLEGIEEVDRLSRERSLAFIGEKL